MFRPSLDMFRGSSGHVSGIIQTCLGYFFVHFNVFLLIFFIFSKIWKNWKIMKNQPKGTNSTPTGDNPHGRIPPRAGVRGRLAPGSIRGLLFCKHWYCWSPSYAHYHTEPYFDCYCDCCHGRNRTQPRSVRRCLRFLAWFPRTHSSLKIGQIAPLRDPLRAP